MSSLAKTIIYGNEQNVADALRYNVKLDEIDEYGYTPLIQTAIVNSSSKAKLLLAAGASVDFQDLTGRTALHWAAENGNYELCSLLLEAKANANAYTYAGQSALVIPILRRNNKIRRLMIDHGADYDFAQDFINAKIIGHCFELQGRTDIVNPDNTFIEIELEGFFLEFSLEILIRSASDFRKNFGGKHLRQYFSYLNQIIGTLKKASELLSYRNYLIDVTKYERSIDALIDTDFLILPIAFEGHAISFIKFYDFLIRCDRGEFGKKNGTVIFYEIGNPTYFTKNMCKQLLYRRQHRNFINHELAKYLELTPKLKLDLPPQRVGNCSWANIDAIIPALMFLFLFYENKWKKKSECETLALNFYRDWSLWDKNRSLHYCLESFKESTPARKAAKAELLASILFQSLKYEDDDDQETARKILNILHHPEYDYILASYLEIFSAPQKSAMLKNLVNFMDDYKSKILRV